MELPLDKIRAQAIIATMKRQQADKAPHAGKREKGPKAWNPKGLRDATGFLRLLLDEIDGFASGRQKAAAHGKQSSRPWGSSPRHGRSCLPRR